jgi:hypothetical protein
VVRYKRLGAICGAFASCEIVSDPAEAVVWIQLSLLAITFMPASGVAASETSETHQGNASEPCTPPRVSVDSSMARPVERGEKASTPTQVARVEYENVTDPLTGRSVKRRIVSYYNMPSSAGDQPRINLNKLNPLSHVRCARPASLLPPCSHPAMSPCSADVNTVPMHGGLIPMLGGLICSKLGQKGWPGAVLHLLFKLVPCARWMAVYNYKDYLQDDLIAGATVGVMIIPQVRCRPLAPRQALRAWHMAHSTLTPSPHPSRGCAEHGIRTNRRVAHVLRTLCVPPPTATMRPHKPSSRASLEFTLHAPEPPSPVWHDRRERAAAVLVRHLWHLAAAGCGTRGAGVSASGGWP